MKFKYILAGVALSLAFSAQAGEPGKTARAKNAITQKISKTTQQARIALAKLHPRSIQRKMSNRRYDQREQVVYVRQKEREYSVNVPRPIIESDIQAPF